MTSQEDIELSRLMLPRPSDHHVARAGATPRPVSAASTTESSSEPAVPELPRPSSHHLSDSNYTIQNASASNDKSPLILDGGEHPRSPSRRKKTSDPWTLRRLPLLGLVTFIVMLIVALEVLYHFSNKNHGLVAAKQDAAYLWKYLPTAILTTLAFYWNKLDYHTKALMPWKLMSEKPQSVDQSLLLDYVSGNPLGVLSGARKYRHVPVIASTTGSLVIVLVTVFFTGLFISQSTLVHEGTTVSVSSAFDGTQFDATAVNSFPILAVSSILSDNLSIDYPPDTNVNYAVGGFSLETTLHGSNASKSGTVEAFQATLDCSNGSINATSVTAQPYYWDIELDMVDDDCTATLLMEPVESLHHVYVEPLVVFQHFYSGLSADFLGGSLPSRVKPWRLLDSQRLYTATTSQIANRFLRANTTMTASGSYRTTQLRVTLRTPALRIIESGLSILIICACIVVMVFSPCPPASTALASIAVILHSSHQLKPRFYRSEGRPLGYIKENLLGQSFSSKGQSNSIQLQGSDTALSTSPTLAAGTTT
ncbi:hypothetical protein M436DRAFT_62036 [Aureobasidium namibiae CBS 147.97]|uniref:Transmembrane protein n=1 Tax=Aureobasidium namibiae CBS 147.97 TaxID=1043004 RepID=A0A074X0V6_9PEZI|nr:uncharacterized protein M436DRAFT_62036 [Aureobasidium namibiae CBS 147.97]KEQ75647.1 hypothetical protein M436DRAFT_62036 [Aureobasidium namibiae CBS 147.97]